MDININSQENKLFWVHSRSKSSRINSINSRKEEKIKEILKMNTDLINEIGD